MSERIRLTFDVSLKGDLGVEQWPSYLTDETYGTMVLGAIKAQNVQVQPYWAYYHRSRFAWFLVGGSEASRKMGLCYDDPRGVVYLLKDDGSDWDGNGRTPPTFEPERAITLCELVREGDVGVMRELGLNERRDRRLRPGRPRFDERTWFARL